MDPQRDLIAHLRTHADLNGELAQFTRPGLNQRAVFRTEAPPLPRVRAHASAVPAAVAAGCY